MTSFQSQGKDQPVPPLDPELKEALYYSMAGELVWWERFHHAEICKHYPTFNPIQVVRDRYNWLGLTAEQAEQLIARDIQALELSTHNAAAYVPLDSQRKMPWAQRLPERIMHCYTTRSSLPPPENLTLSELILYADEAWDMHEGRVTPPIFSALAAARYIIGMHPETGLPPQKRARFASPYRDAIKKITNGWPTGTLDAYIGNEHLVMEHHRGLTTATPWTSVSLKTHIKDATRYL